MKELALSHKSLKDRSNALKRGCTLQIEDHYPLIRQMCFDSLNSVSFFMEDEALILLGDCLHSNEHNNADGTTTSTNTAYTSNNNLTPWHAFWAQRRCHIYLDAVEKVMEHAPAAAMQLEMAGCNDNKVTISPWRLPHLVFDVTVGEADIYDTVSGSFADAVMSSGRKRTSLPAGASSARTKATRSGLSGFYSQEVGNPNDASSDHLPISVQVRAVSEVYLVGESLSSSGKWKCAQKVLPECKIEILRVVHKQGVTAGSGGAHHAGDVALLLSLLPVVGRAENEGQDGGRSASLGLRVKEARMMQINAIPPQHNACVDLYTSTSMEDESEITIALRFLTKRCQNEAPPQLVIDLIVEY